MSIEARVWQWLSHLIMISFSLMCLIPFYLLIISSFTAETAIVRNGYSFLPELFSLQAYEYLLGNLELLGRAYGITIFVTVLGTAMSLMITALLAYSLSKKEIPGHRVFTFLVFFTLLFNGGLAPTYLIYTQYFEIKNTIWALIIPNLLMNGFNVLLARAFFMNTIPAPILESARIDGAGEYRTFFQIVLPLSMPIMATIGLFSGIAYWNDWNNGLIYLTNPKLYSIQNLLNHILQNIEYLTSASNMYGSQSMGAIEELPGETARMAIAVIGVIPILIAYPFFQRYFVKGITIGAVKG